MFSATDIASFLACRHTATLARAESKDEITKPFFKNQTIDLLRKLGLEHEQRYLRELSDKGRIRGFADRHQRSLGRCRRGDGSGDAPRRRCRLSSNVSGRTVGRSL